MFTKSLNSLDSPVVSWMKPEWTALRAVEYLLDDCLVVFDHFDGCG